MKFLKGGNNKIILYCIIAALAVYALHMVTKTLNNLSSTVKKSIPWIAGAAAVVGLAFLVHKNKSESKTA